MSRLNSWRIILLLSGLVYLLSNLYRYTFIEQDLSATLIISLMTIKSLPIALFFPWVLKPNYKASLFLCLILLCYIIIISNSMFLSGSKGAFAIAEGIIICLLFSASFVLGKLHKT